MSKNLGHIFEKLLTRYLSTIEKKYRERYRAARQKSKVLAELKKETGIFIALSENDPEQRKIVEIFNVLYNRGSDVNEIFFCMRNIFNVHDHANLSKVVSRTLPEQVTFFIGGEDKALKYLSQEERNLMKFILRDVAYRKIHGNLDTMFTDEWVS